ncbi:GATA zinc finger domain-containing protein 10-like [Aplysia californica]|uniref:GATA zinc finger domain-containing protein 10-like n=1 Tax=Aplysia californica TaxID=6500 RepID=A0ABM0JE70_APLCA|nr:GATA zinc finger domain-containing protein 10-like [Aplysia californica]
MAEAEDTIKEVCPLEDIKQGEEWIKMNERQQGDFGKVVITLNRECREWPQGATDAEIRQLIEDNSRHGDVVLYTEESVKLGTPETLKEQQQWHILQHFHSGVIKHQQQEQEKKQQYWQQQEQQHQHQQHRQQQQQQQQKQQQPHQFEDEGSTSHTMERPLVSQEGREETSTCVESQKNIQPTDIGHNQQANPYMDPGEEEEAAMILHRLQ